MDLDANKDSIRFQQIDVVRYENTLQMFGSTVAGHSVTCFIKNIPSQAVVDEKFAGSNWINLRAGLYEMRAGDKRTRCQIEVDIDFDHVVVEQQSRQPIVPFRILSIEVEAFNAVNGESIVSIANMVMCNGEDEPFVRSIFTTSACNTIDNTQVWICKDEKDLLEQWMAFVGKIDPDIVTGYNIDQFDLPLLRRRMNFLELPEWKRLGRNDRR